jgi:hypothetical protein
MLPKILSGSYTFDVFTPFEIVGSANSFDRKKQVAAQTSNQRTLNRSRFPAVELR